jgi:hypothetical protein
MPVPAIIAGAAAVAGRVAAKKAAKEVAKKATKKAAEKIASNSVKVVKANKAAVRLEKNSQAKANADTARSGAMARYNAGQIEKARQRPAKVVKVNSAVKSKSADTAKSANAKALKAANKKGKK